MIESKESSRYLWLQKKNVCGDGLQGEYDDCKGRFVCRVPVRAVVIRAPASFYYFSPTSLSLRLHMPSLQ